MHATKKPSYAKFYAIEFKYTPGKPLRISCLKYQRQYGTHLINNNYSDVS